MSEGEKIEKKIIRRVKNHIGERIDDENKLPSKVLLNKSTYGKYKEFKGADILSLKLKNSEVRITISKDEHLEKEIKLIP